jgi:NAD(P)H-dependent FMN reductase
MARSVSKPRVGIIIGTTREGRFGDRPAAWIKKLADKHGKVDTEIVDLRDYQIPFFDQPGSPAYVGTHHDEAKRWEQKMGELDGYIFVTAEYNHGPSAVLKNALDHAYNVYNKKPAAFVGYGALGAARAIQQLRQNLVELKVAPLRDAVHINMTEYLGVLKEGKSFDDYPYLTQTANTMLDELEWWTIALNAARSEITAAAA